MSQNIILCILLAIILGYGIYLAYQWWQRKQVATTLSQEDFEAGMRQAQVVDVREANEFRSAHITGARNVPYSSLQQGVPGFNKSQPIYLYDDGVALAGRAAAKFYKAGFTDLYILQGGFREWDGRTKRRDA
ncbi:rhodanese-like domain-containing protein [Aerococcus sanguinicola]|uniref:Rhodanese-like domain-containing protein n=1 Tax=Aerococcus sanguinicola TaxID=119206 RepID=A0A0X8FC37_9LACT|nr:MULTISPECIES: rhodanese-like domain-containing protein [Aerococcus]AMB94610.1 sulfurtransferase [Aerococcus sanguinicola]MDK7049493.1 rhodanese-like domain-containing protein [Aerococcus sanguinicola]OFT96912.1 sulfurtransferase [Aerococcus sp. HMSC23C02]PKZ23393.1 rhodanese-like domain-containing protein [Aerococcus sanguinicola]